MTIQINKLKKGERFNISSDDERIYIRGDYVFKENKYACSPLNDPQQTELFAGTKLVYQVFAYGWQKKE